MFSDISSAVEEVKTLESGGAAVRTCEILDSEEVLLSLVAVSSESHVDGDDVVTAHDVEVAVHVHSVDHAVRKIEEGRFNLLRHSNWNSRIEFNGNCCEGFVQPGLVSESKSSSALCTRSGGLDRDSLGLVLEGSKLVEAAVHHVIAVRTQALGAVDISILRITNAPTNFFVVKAIVGE